MLMIGWSGSYTYLAVQRYWIDLQTPAGRVSTRRRSICTAVNAVLRQPDRPANPPEKPPCP